MSITASLLNITATCSSKYFKPVRLFFLSQFIAFILTVTWGSVAYSHALAPSLLQIKELPQQIQQLGDSTSSNETSNTNDSQLKTARKRISVLWKTNRKGSPKQLLPALPNQCQYEQTPVSRFEGNAIISNAVLACDVPTMVGATFGVSNLIHTPTNVLLRYIRSDGTEVNQLLSATQPVFTVPKEKSTANVAWNYLQLGFEHLISGWDHLLFVLALMLIMRELRGLILAITSFTIGHSITLAMATMGWVQLPSSFVEIAIALSIVILALELLNQKPERSFLERRFWLVPMLFGLLHGLGFAGALAETGLPQNSLVPALLAFNIGIELGQLMVVVIALTAAALWKALYRLITQSSKEPTPQPLNNSLTASHKTLMAYFIGSISAYWVIERAFLS